MAYNPLTKVARQHENTWASLQRRVAGIPYSYTSLFPQDVMQFIENKAVSLGSSIGYFAPALLTTTAFILANNEAKVKTFNYEQIPNIFTLFVGYPGTGKSVSVEQGATSPVLTVCGKIITLRNHILTSYHRIIVSRKNISYPTFYLYLPFITLRNHILTSYHRSIVS